MTDQYWLPRKFPAFQDLRIMPWEPHFHLTRTVDEAAENINRPHEDYPNRILATRQAITNLLAQFPSAADLQEAFSNDILLQVHRTIFADARHGGSWRQIPVRVSHHVPPEPDLIPKLMEQLAEAYRGQITDQRRLTAWHKDFETIHPFADGNGRVGGAMVAFASHRLAPAQGFLTPGQ